MHYEGVMRALNGSATPNRANQYETNSTYKVQDDVMDFEVTGQIRQMIRLTVNTSCSANMMMLILKGMERHFSRVTLS